MRHLLFILASALLLPSCKSECEKAAESLCLIEQQKQLQERKAKCLTGELSFFESLELNVDKKIPERCANLTIDQTELEACIAKRNYACLMKGSR